MNNELLELIEKYITGSFSSRSSEMIFEGLMTVGSTFSLFKYTSATSGIRSLKEGTLFFNSPLNFNDIRDCNPKMLQLTDEYLTPLAKGVIQKTYPGKYTSKQIDNLLRSPNTRRALFPEARKIAVETSIGRVLITCFTLHNSNELMWAHYSDNHKGICIEYDSHGLLHYFNTLLIKPIFFKVHYVSEIKPIKVGGKDVEGDLIKWLVTKSESWSYEDEIRCVFLNKEGVINPVKIPSFLIKGIYLGQKISQDDRSVIVSYANNQKNDIRLYDMGLGDDLVLTQNLI